MNVRNRIATFVLLALGALGLVSARAETYDSTEFWEIPGSASVGKSFSFTMPEEMPEESDGTVYYKLSGVSSPNEYTFTATGGDAYAEVVYTYKYVDKYEGGSDTYIEYQTIGYMPEEETAGISTWFIGKESWEDDIVEDPMSETGAKVKPTGYYLHIYGNAGETISVSSAKGIVYPPKAGKVTVTLRGAPDATWSIKGQAGSYTNGHTVSIMGQKTVTFSTVKGLTKPADQTVTPLKDNEEFHLTGVYGVTLTLKGTDVTAEYDGETRTGSFTVVPGEEVKLSSPERYEVKSVGYLFQCWTPSKAYDFGADYSADKAETTIVMPTAALTMTATALKTSEIAYMTVYAYGDPVVIGEETIKPAEGDLLWSTDGKAWYVCGPDKKLFKKGSYTLQWKSASGSWVGPTAKTKVTLKGGDDWSNSENPAKFTFATILRVAPVVYVYNDQGGAWSESTAGGTVTMTPADGRIKETATAVSLTAKANKNYVFVGWQYEKSWDEVGYIASGSATVKMTLKSGDLTEFLDEEDHQVHYQAVFRSTSDYTEESVKKAVPGVSVNGTIFEPTYDEGELEGEVEVKLGLNIAATVSFLTTAEARPATLKLTGTLPKGLKFDAKTGILSGTPTVSGTYPLELTVTDPAGNECTLSVSLVVYSVFDPVVGDWRAFLMDEEGLCAGLFEMSVTDKGKASAKITTVSGTTSCAPTVTWTPDAKDPDAPGTFSIEYYKMTGNLKTGSSVYLSVGTDGEKTVEFVSKTWKNEETTSEIVLSGTPVRGESKWFKDEDFADAFLGKYYTVALTAEEGLPQDGYRTPVELVAPGYLTVTTDKKGAVKVAGKLSDGEKVSASAVLLPASDGQSASAMLFVVPSGYKKKGSVALQLDFDAEGGVSASVGSWTTPPLLDAIAGHEPAEEAEQLFLPGLLSLGAEGAIYSKLDDLAGYYLGLSVAAGFEEPTLEYSYTDADKTKVYELASPALDGYELDSDQLKGGTGGKITVEKSPSPWKDSDGVWHYDETKVGEAITNPGSVTISFKSATGVFSGKFNLFFDYEVPQYGKSGEEKDPKKEHKSVSCSYEGVLVGTTGRASAQYSGKYTYQYETTAGKAATKTYTKKNALTVDWTLGEDE